MDRTVREWPVSRTPHNSFIFLYVCVYNEVLCGGEAPSYIRNSILPNCVFSGRLAARDTFFPVLETRFLRFVS